MPTPAESGWISVRPQYLKKILDEHRILTTTVEALLKLLEMKKAK